MVDAGEGNGRYGQNGYDKDYYIVDVKKEGNEELSIK